MSDRVWNRLGAACGLLYVVLLFGPTSTGSDAPIVTILAVFGMLLFIPFLGYLWSILRQAEGEGGWLSATAFGAGLASITIKLASAGPGFAARTEGLDPQLHQALDKINSVDFIVAMLPLSVMMAAVAIVALRTRVLPLWLGAMAALTAPALLVNGMFFDSEIGPAFLVFLLWTLLASVVLTLRAGEARLVANDRLVERGAPAA
jgi:hypothetical protein